MKQQQAIIERLPYRATRAGYPGLCNLLKQLRPHPRVVYFIWWVPSEERSSGLGDMSILFQDLV